MVRKTFNIAKEVDKVCEKHSKNIFRRSMAAYCKLHPAEELDNKYIKICNEKVENYTVPVYTVRYKDVILFRILPSTPLDTTRTYECYLLDR